jgi:uncharacterized DUF497 family protein
MADREFIHRGTTFRWGELKAEQNLRKHGIAFEEAATVFDDPLLVVEDASRNEEQRDAAIGFSSNGRLLTVVHIEVGYEYIRIISARRASSAEEAIYAE